MALPSTSTAETERLLAAASLDDLLASALTFGQLAQAMPGDDPKSATQPADPVQIAAAPDVPPPASDTPFGLPTAVGDSDGGGGGFSGTVFVTTPPAAYTPPPPVALGGFGGFGGLPTFMANHSFLVSTGYGGLPSSFVPLSVAVSIAPPHLIPQDHNLAPHPTPAPVAPTAAHPPTSGSGSFSVTFSSSVRVSLAPEPVAPHVFSDSFFVGTAGYAASLPTDHAGGGVFGMYAGVASVSGSGPSAAITVFGAGPALILLVNNEITIGALTPNPPTVTLAGPAGLQLTWGTPVLGPLGGSVTLVPTGGTTTGGPISAVTDILIVSAPVFAIGSSMGGTTGLDTLIGGAGADFFNFSWPGTLQSGDQVNGGAGADTLVATFLTNTALAQTLVIDNVETITLAGQAGTIVSLNAANIHGAPGLLMPTTIVSTGAADLKVVNLAVNLDSSGGTGSIDVTASGDGIAILGGAGNDTITAAPGSSHTTIVGGAGNNLLTGAPGDTLAYSLAPHGATIDFQSGLALDNGYGGVDTISGFDHVIGAKTGTNTVTMAAHMTLHVANVQVVHGDSTVGDDTLVIDRATPGGVTVDHVARVTGSVFNDRITIADATPTTIDGNGGFDTLIAGGGADTFVLKTLLSGGGFIEHFDTTADRIELGSVVAFPGLGASGQLDPARFIHDAGTFTGNYSATLTHGMNAAFDAGQAVIVQDAGGYLYYAVHPSTGYSVATLAHVDATLSAANIHLHP